MPNYTWVNVHNLNCDFRKLSNGNAVLKRKIINLNLFLVHDAIEAQPTCHILT